MLLGELQRASTMKAFIVCFAVCMSLASAGPSWRDASSFRHIETKADWCDPVLGCLSYDDTWFGPSRPINVQPDARSKINTQFLLHTRADTANSTDVFIRAEDLSTVDSSTFDPTKPCKFIIHGFVDTGNTRWLKQFADVLLQHGDYNVFRVDWGDGSLPLYSQAVANTRVVGLEIGLLVNTLIAQYGVKAADVHLHGHSLGSHISGYAGEQIPGLGRISGLDPAGPYFSGTPPHVRLDQTDAVFVDAIHTDADTILLLGYGTEEAMGNIDFYPNSGHDQPGCNPVNVAIDLITDIGDGDYRELAACSHCRSIYFYMDSLTNTCPYTAHECPDYLSFEDGRCNSCGADNSKCAFMGVRASEYTQKTRENVKLYLDTDKDVPYCLYHNSVNIALAHPKEAEVWVQGHLTLWLYGDNGNSFDNLEITDGPERFYHGQSRTFMFKSHIDIGTVIRAELAWKYDATLIDPTSMCGILCNEALYVQSIEFSAMDYYPEENRLAHTKLTCASGGGVTEMQNGKIQAFVPSSACIA